MKLQHVTDILASVDIEPVGRDVLMRLAGTPAGQRFHAALLAIEAGHAGQRSILLQIIAQVDGGGVEEAVITPTAASASLDASPAAPANAPSKKPAPYFNFSIFAATAALCISEATIRSTGQQTIQVEAAAVLTGGARRAFDWPNKITMQLNEQEVFQLAALLQGKINAVAFDSHGHAHDKFMRARRQDHSFFIEVGQLGRPLRGIPVKAPDALRIVSLAYRQIMANSPHLDATTVSTMLDQVAAMHVEPSGRRPAA